MVSIGSDNGLSPIRRQAIIWTNAVLLSIGPLGTKFSEILIKIQIFSFTKMHLKISSVKWRPFCPRRDEWTLFPDDQSLRESIPRLLNEGTTTMTACCAPVCSQALPIKPQGVWARSIEAWARSRDLRIWSCGLAVFGALQPNEWPIGVYTYTCLLLLISMLWHRQAIFESKGDKLSSSAECRIRTHQGLRHQIASRHAHTCTYAYTYIQKYIYSQVPLKHGLIYHGITYDTAIGVPENESDIRITTDTPYFTLTGKLWGVYYENFGENWPRFNGTALYLVLCWVLLWYHSLALRHQFQSYKSWHISSDQDPLKKHQIYIKTSAFSSLYMKYNATISN